MIKKNSKYLLRNGFWRRNFIPSMNLFLDGCIALNADFTYVWKDCILRRQTCSIFITKLCWNKIEEKWIAYCDSSIVNMMPEQTYTSTQGVDWTRESMFSYKMTKRKIKFFNTLRLAVAWLHLGTQRAVGGNGQGALMHTICVTTQTVPVGQSVKAHGLIGWTGLQLSAATQSDTLCQFQLSAATQSGTLCQVLRLDIYNVLVG